MSAPEKGQQALKRAKDHQKSLKNGGNRNAEVSNLIG